MNVLYEDSHQNTPSVNIWSPPCPSRQKVLSTPDLTRLQADVAALRAGCRLSQYFICFFIRSGSVSSLDVPPLELKSSSYKVTSLHWSHT